MEIFKPESLKIDFSKYFKFFTIFSALATVISLALFFNPGLHYSIDFKGGMQMDVEFSNVDVNEASLRELLGGQLKNLSIQSTKSDKGTNFLITSDAEDKTSMSTVVTKALEGKYGKINEAWKIAQTNVVGPSIGSSLKKAALLSLIYTCLLIGIYMWWRFDTRFVPGALACIFHDLIFTTGFLVLMGIEFDNTIVAALLTLAGYSINDTVVVFDRIREMEDKYLGRPKKDIVNMAINSTLGRTMLTAGTTLISCLVIYLVGGPTLKPFALTLIFGITVGTYSSAFVASPLYIWASKIFAADSHLGSQRA